VRGLQDCLKSSPEELLQELVKCFVVKVVMSQVWGLSHLLSPVRCLKVVECLVYAGMC